MKLLHAAIVGILAGCAKQPEVTALTPPSNAPAGTVAPVEKTKKPDEKSTYVAPTPTITPIEQHPTPMGGPTHACAGQNACKGLGGCKTPKNACKGLNDCKGQGGCKG